MIFWNKTHIFTVSATCLLCFIVSCTNTSAINAIEKSRLHGSILGFPLTELPQEPLIHVLIQHSSPSSPRKKIIAEKTISMTQFTSNTTYSIDVPTSYLTSAQTHFIQACVTVNGKLHMISHEQTQKFSKSNRKVNNIVLEPLWSLSKKEGIRTWTSGKETTLYNSIQSNLSGTCQTSSSSFDKIMSANASELLPTHLLSGANHKVEELVTLRGPQYLFQINSTFGKYSVQGLPMLRRTIREINAMEVMKKIENSEEFITAFSDEALDPFGELKALILNPIDRLYGAVKGVGKFIHSTSASLTQKRSHYEDRYLEALLSVSKYKRQFSQQLQVDTYSNNIKMQKRLNRIGWAAALGSWTPSILLMPISGPKKLAYSSLNFQETLNQLVTEESPDSLRYSNKKFLQSINVSDNTIDQFLSHKYYTPRHHTVIVNAFKSMGEVKGIESFLEQALNVKSDTNALLFQQIAEQLMGYHLTQEAIIEIQSFMGIPFGITKTSHWVMLLPIDIGRWSHFAEMVFTGFNKLHHGQINVQKSLWISGKSTLLFQNNIKKMGFTFIENSQQQLSLLD